MLTYAGPDITDFKEGPNIAVPQHDEIGKIIKSGSPT